MNLNILWISVFEADGLDNPDYSRKREKEIRAIKEFVFV